MKLEVPINEGAEERAWQVVHTAFEERTPSPRERKLWRPVVVLAAAAVIAGAVASPPGQAVLDSIREAVGIERAQPALFSLPVPGRLLVESADGVWVVRTDGSKRRLGDWREASWSPFGRFVVVARANELAAVEPNGDVRWSLARPNVRFPRWGGTKTDTRIAYLSQGQLRVVGGDGKGDRLIDPQAATEAPVWKRGRGHRLAYGRRDGSVRVVDVDTRRVLDRDAPEALEEPSSARKVVLRTIGSGRFDQPVLSPDGRWLAVGWPDADQFVFMGVGRQQIRAVSNVSSQFRSRSFPTISGWCCVP